MLETVIASIRPLLLLMLLLAGGCPGREPTADSGVDAGAGDAAPVCEYCPDGYGQPVASGTIGVPGLNELSGIAASRSYSDIFYVHDDSGGAARFFAIDRSGALRGEYTLAGAGANDWEDIAVGPCDDGWCVYLGDIGDNAETRNQYRIFRTPEPAALDLGEPLEVAWQSFAFVYPDGSHNCETLLVHPLTADLYIVAKTIGSASVYKLTQPLDDGLVANADWIGAIDLPDLADAMPTGGDFHPCGDRLLIRTYGPLLEYQRPAESAVEAIFESPFLRVPVAAESQGEAVSYLPSGLGYATASEGASPRLHLVECQ